MLQTQVPLGAIAFTLPAPVTSGTFAPQYQQSQGLPRSRASPRKARKSCSPFSDASPPALVQGAKAAGTEVGSGTCFTTVTTGGGASRGLPQAHDKAMTQQPVAKRSRVDDCTAELPAWRPSASEEDAGTDTDDETAAALLLGMGNGGSGSAVADAEQHYPIPVPRRKRTAGTHRPAQHLQSASARAADMLLDEVPYAGARVDAMPAVSTAAVVCSQCRNPVTLTGERRPTFVCVVCRSKNGGCKRAQRALLAADLSVTVTVQQALNLAGAPASAQLSQHDNDSGSLNSSKDAASTHLTAHGAADGCGVNSEGDNNSRAEVDAAVECDATPSAAKAATTAAASDHPSLSEGSGDGAGDASHGRCKCGKRIAPNHPPCKSELMLLCEKFQRRFGGLDEHGRPQQIMLKEAVAELGVSRRRLYDIINVLEAVEVVRRTGKLTYEWRGLAHLPTLLQRLCREEFTGVPVEERLKRTPAVGAVPDEGPRIEDVRTMHTLWALSRKFVRVLLTRKGPLPLTEVATLLMDDGVAAQRKNQTQITIERRLYDIGSILTAVGLIEKTYLGKRQPAFMWKLPWTDAECSPLAQHPDAGSQPSSPAIPQQHAASMAAQQQQQHGADQAAAAAAAVAAAAHWQHMSAAALWPSQQAHPAGAAALPHPHSHLRHSHFAAVAAAATAGMEQHQAAAAAGHPHPGLFHPGLLGHAFGLPPGMMTPMHLHHALLPSGFGSVATLLHPSVAAAAGFAPMLPQAGHESGLAIAPGHALG